ncbi:MAG: hypothetical protein CMA62_02820 [Euryarchaeota archaeon]|jgi:hypothetical protein|nr:hypothetical protein [Euryarchaeota archaeon]MBT86436.1 hypothetical protein [Euryarchaeota archaeon]|tara:strand:+ start:217 stop:564 length:348 start_codon:yes stop_codon:yes gene_type:complete
MVKSMEITKLSVREKLVVDVSVWMNNPEDYDFSPRASLDGSTMNLFNGNEEAPSASIQLDDEQIVTAERDRMVELRVKFAVEGMHGILTNKTKNVRDGPNAKKLAEPRWKTILPL